MNAKVKNPDPKDPISGFQVSGVRCQVRKKTETTVFETSKAIEL